MSLEAGAKQGAMQIDVLGHASLLVRAGDGSTALFDPLLPGRHQNGVYDLFPARALDIDALPRIDVIVVSHVHQDHFDLDTLALFDRRITVVVPDDPLVASAIAALGFESVEVVSPLDEVEIGGLTLVPTAASDATITEHGFVVTDGERVMWNLVDTLPTAEDIAAVKARFPRIDLAFVPWMPLQDAEFQSGLPVRFPYGMYDRMLANAAQIDAEAYIAGSCGFAAIGPAAWSNHVIFPVTRERFLADLGGALPGRVDGIHPADAGDRVELGPALRIGRQTLGYCKSEPYDWRAVAWRPFELGFPVVEATPGFGREATRESLRSFFEGALADTLSSHPRRFDAHRRWAVRHQFEVVCHDGVDHWLVDFTSATPRITHDRCPLATKHTVIAVGALLGLVAGALSWEAVVLGGLYRHHDHTYLVDERGVRPCSARLEDPLRVMLPTRDALERKLATDLRRLVSDDRS